LLQAGVLYITFVSFIFGTVFGALAGGSFAFFDWFCVSVVLFFFEALEIF